MIAGTVVVFRIPHARQCGLAIECLCDQHLQIFRLERFGQVVKRTQFHGVYGRPDVVQTGDHDDIDIRARLLDPAQYFDTVHLRHLDVQDQHIVVILIDQAQRRQAIPGNIDLVVVTAKNALATAQDDLFVVNDQNAPFHSVLPPMGRDIRNSVPTPTSLETSIIPPWATMVP